jgi:hypothetical protein
MLKQAPGELETVQEGLEAVADLLEGVPASVETDPEMVETAMGFPEPIATDLEVVPEPKAGHRASLTVRDSIQEVCDAQPANSVEAAAS